jgi:hypothetical protein
MRDLHGVALAKTRQSRSPLIQINAKPPRRGEAGAMDFAESTAARDKPYAALRHRSDRAAGLRRARRRDASRRLPRESHAYLLGTSVSVWYILNCL